MSTIEHEVIAAANRHAVHRFQYADAAAREADTSVTSADLYKYAVQLDDNSVWMLIATTPTWVPISPEIFGDTGATDNAILRADGVGGATLKNSLITIDNTGIVSFPDDVRQTFNPGTNNAGLNVGSLAGDPATPSNGDIWYDSTANELTARINGSNVALSGGGGSIAPLVIESANVVGQRNSTNAQTFKVYSTYTSGSDYGVLQIDSTAGPFHRIRAEGLITGGDPGLILSCEGEFRFSPANNDSVYYKLSGGGFYPRTGGEELGTSSNRWGVGYANEWHANSRIRFINSSGFEPTNTGSVGPTDSSNNPATFCYRASTPSQITSNQNNYALGNPFWKRLSSDAERTITGFQIDFGSSSNGETHLLTNVGSFNIIIAHQSASSSGSNRVVCPQSTDMLLAPGEEVFLIWDPTTDRWRAVKWSNGNLDIPQNSQSADYTFALTDRGGHVYHPVADTNNRTWTIPANASVAFPIGSVITLVNEINTITVAITSDTLVFAGTGSTGSRSLAANGIATLLKVTSTRWYINGTGVT